MLRHKESGGRGSCLKQARLVVPVWIAYFDRAPSRKRGSQLGEICYNEIRLMWCLTKWPLAAVDERGPHAIRLCANAVEGMIGNKQNVGAVMANDLFRFRVGLPVRFEIAGFL